ncbi:MAG: 3-oxoacyl-ACP reductase FabG [Planctomycetaceae bacterium]
MIPIDLAGQTALITGGGQGLGLASATLLHRAGAHVVINFFDDTSGANRQKAADAVAALGDRALSLPADVRSVAQVQEMLRQVIKQCGRLDIIVNNAAIMRDRTAKNMSLDDWQAVIDTNLSGVFHVCQAAIPHLADGGRIVNMASIAGLIGFFGQANYAAAKAGVIGLTKVLSKELASRGIRVNAVAPGVALTEMGQSIPENVRDAMLTQIPLKRFAEPEEIAQVVLFLCSNLSSYVTGQTLHVNGGWWG